MRAAARIPNRGATPADLEGLARPERDDAGDARELTRVPHPGVHPIAWEEDVLRWTLTLFAFSLTPRVSVL